MGTGLSVVESLYLSRGGVPHAPYAFYPMLTVYSGFSVSWSCTSGK